MKKYYFAGAAVAALIATCAILFWKPNSITITTGNTYQEILPSSPAKRHSITIQNTNLATETKPGDNCWILFGSPDSPWLIGDTTATTRAVSGYSLNAKQVSILLMSAGSYTRYFPYVPSDPILGTCEKSGDKMYVKAE